MATFTNIGINNSTRNCKTEGGRTTFPNKSHVRVYLRVLVLYEQFTNNQFQFVPPMPVVVSFLREEFSNCINMNRE